MLRAAEKRLFFIQYLLESLKNMPELYYGTVTLANKTEPLLLQYTTAISLVTKNSHLDYSGAEDNGVDLLSNKSQIKHF